MSILELFRMSEGNIKSLRVLNQIEVDSIISNCSKLIAFQRHHALIEYVIYNYNALNDLFVKKAIQYTSIELNDLGYPFDNLFLESNALILNFLASARTFIDHMEANIRKSDNEKGTKISFFKELTAHEFDSKFSYKFMGKLRNYVQHCGMPPLNYTISKNHEDNNILNTTLNVMFNRDALLREYDSWGSHVIPQLKAQTPEFSIFILMNEYIYSLIKIYITYTKQDNLLGTLKAKQEILSIINQGEGYYLNDYAIGKITPQDEGVKINPSTIPASLLKKIDTFSKIELLLEDHKATEFFDYNSLKEIIKYKQ
ncbi:hypothetical protein ACUY4R_000151 [Kosakonia sp. BK9b]